ncbi:hypothetical protein GCM10007304_22440 [Rhodococcoides trifolii]|uniref:Uncharacterized protein n=1 Tax=Rhodococcoides trifolii TaxID=908250 RepID=A0A917FV19_9NOCA|nr:hypothetical protein [Rhodococcus trifolii]GGG07891.1 hypothetical protein GCM10007304_22440 [Rhodococcus trifolii]
MVRGARLIFVRRGDGLRYTFESEGAHAFKRVDLDVWCRRLPDFGWVVCDGDGTVSSRPFTEAGTSDMPPEGVWVSYKGDRSYVYDMTRIASADTKRRQ